MARAGYQTLNVPEAWPLAPWSWSFAIVAVTAAVVLRTVAPEFIWIPLACLLAGSAVFFARVTAGDDALTGLVGVSFVLRCVLAVALFAISAFELPILTSLHREGGLWVFGGDGGGYQEHALKIMDAWRAGAPLSSAFVKDGVPYELYKVLALPMAMTYAALGTTSPLNFMLVNAWFAALSGLLAYLLALRLGHHRLAALAAGGLVAFWPSSLVWSTQLLKDSIFLALLLAALLTVTALLQRYSSSCDRRGFSRVDAALWIALPMVVFGSVYFRHYMGSLLAIVVASVLGLAVLGSLWRRRWREAVAAVAITGVVGMAVLSGITVDLLNVLSPTATIELGPPPPDIVDVYGLPGGVDASTVGVLERWDIELAWGLSWLSLDNISDLREAQVAAVGGTSTIDHVDRFEGVLDLALYTPRALAIAYFAPFPWQLMSVGGNTGAMRPLAGPEMLLIMLLAPAMVVGGWQRVKRGRPEDWVLVVFVLIVALANGLIMANGGTLFRWRLQYLFPSLIMASSALPAFAYRFVGTLVNLPKTSDGSPPAV